MVKVLTLEAVYRQMPQTESRVYTLITVKFNENISRPDVISLMIT